MTEIADDPHARIAAPRPDGQATAPANLADDMRRVLELFADAPGGMIITSGPDHVVTMMNAAYSAWIDHRDVVGMTVRDAFPNLAELGFHALLDKVFATGRSEVIRGSRTRVGMSGGVQREAYVNFVLQPMRAADGSVSGIFCQGHEVTNEKLAADELRAAHEKARAALNAFQTIFDVSHDVICTVSADGCFRQVNRHAERMWGYTPDELVGRPHLDFIHPDDLEKTLEIAERVAAGETTTVFTNRFLHKDGTTVPIMWSGVWSEADQCLIAIGRDMRDHVAAEEKLRQAQKMEAVGRLSGGIAHDFNNLLTVVIGATEMLTEALAGRPELEQAARVALEAAERGAELVSQLMAVSRTQPLAPQTVNCNRFLEALLPILQRTLGNGIDVTLEPAPSEICCLADLTQLTSAMLNLCINARDAMPDGGRLVLRAEQADDMVVLAVRDTGEGMSPATRARALEPFFTTKPEGKGSGLGLSMVYGFAEQSGGRLEIESEPGVGTRVAICLPATTLCAQAPIGLAPVSPLTRGLKVLLVEDDDLVRGQVLRQLTALGCEAQACSNGLDALDVLAAGDAFDLLMTDVNMPGGLNGRQLADHARLLDPRLPILFTSGHTEDPILRSVGHDPNAAFLPKPYRRADLARKLIELTPEPA